MDPLAVSSAVVTVSAQCIRTARALHDLCSKYKDASVTITAIYSETTIISTSLAQIQGLCTKDPDALRSVLQGQPDLGKTFDQALTGCVLVYSVLDDKIQELYAGIEKNGLASTLQRFKIIWNESIIQGLLAQIRGQQWALNLLIQTLQM